MNGRSGIATFFLFVLLGVLLLVQLLAMVQSERVEQRVVRVEQKLEDLAAAPPMRTATRGTDAGAEQAQAPVGDEGDWLVWRMGAEPRTLNPLTSSDLAASYIGSGIWESLLEYDPDTLAFRTVLARSYQVSDDGLQYTFQLRDDIHFSDGTPITADDVLFSFETLRNPGVDAAQLANYYRDVDRLEKLGEREVRFVFRQPYFKALGIAGGMSVLPRHAYAFDDAEAFNQMRQPRLGSGPYVFEKWDVGREVVLRRNERYWKQKPQLKKIVFRFITNDTAAVQALRAGDADYMRPLPEQYYELSRNEEFTDNFQCLTYSTPGDGYFYIGWNQRTRFFADRNVRLAMTLLVDREAIRDHLMRGLAIIPTGPFYVHSPQHDPTVEPWPYDPARAAELLDQAGWVDTDGDGIRDRDGEPFRFRYMIVAGVSLHEQVVKLVKDSMAQVGIVVEPDPFEWSVFTERLQERKFEAVNLAWGGSVESDPFQIWHSSQSENRGSNYIGFNLPEADRLIEEARRTLDPERRNAMYREFHRLLHEEQPYTFVYSRPSMRFLDRRFHNVKVHKLGLDPHEWYVPRELQKYQ